MKRKPQQHDDDDRSLEAKQEEYLRRFAKMSPAEQRRDLLIMIAFIADVVAKKAAAEAEAIDAEYRVVRAEEERIDRTVAGLLEDVEIEP